MFEMLLIDQLLTSVRNENLRAKLQEKKLSTIQALILTAAIGRDALPSWPQYAPSKNPHVTSNLASMPFLEK